MESLLECRSGLDEPLVVAILQVVEAMTPQERAEKICQSYFGFPTVHLQGNDKRLYEEIAAEIEAAQKERREKFSDCGYSNGFKKGLEEAANIADNHKVCEEGKCWSDIADEIRRRAQELS